MGIRFSCPNGHKLNVKNFLGGKRKYPQCGAKFVIPMPADSPEAEALQPVGVNQSQSVEIAVSPAPGQVANTAASPSVIISVSELDTPPQSELEPLAILPPEIPASILPPVNTAVVPPMIAAEPVAVAPEPVYVSQRSRSRRNQIVISVILLVLVVVLAVVLFWVLWRDRGQLTGGKTTASHGEYRQTLAMVADRVTTSASANNGVPEQ